MKQNTAAEAAKEIESANNDVVRAVSEWTDCDLAALVEDRGNIGPVTRLGDVVNIKDFDAAPFILVEVNLR